MRLTFQPGINLTSKVKESSEPGADPFGQVPGWAPRREDRRPSECIYPSPSLPGKTSPELEMKVLALRAERKLGPARIGPLVGLAPSTVHAVLTRHRVCPHFG